MDATTNTSGQTSDNNAFKSYSESQSVKPANMKQGGDYTPTATGKTSAPHQLGGGSGLPTSAY